MKGKNMRSRHGSAIITAIGMGIVLLFVIAGVQTFTSYRTQTIIQESRRVKALAIAEAGMELVLAELTKNSAFATHKLDKNLVWLATENRQQSLQDLSTHGFKLNSATSGTYSGKIGDGTFRVRVGLIPYADDPKTTNIDESLSYLRIEALGKYDTTVRRVDAVINRRYPAREFLMYDGGVLSMVYGLPNLSNKNVFSTGHLYGHKGIEIGRIMLSAHSPVGHGTTQELSDMNAIISGAGGIFIYSPIQAQFRERRGLPAKTAVIPTNTTFPTGGTFSSPQARKNGEMPKEIADANPDLPEELRPWIKEKNDKMSMNLEEPTFTTYKTDAKTPKGLFFSKTDSSNKSIKYRMPAGWTKDNSPTLDAVYLDFGSNLRTGNVTLPANFNGVIYSEKNIVVKGNPPKDIHIVSDANVFMAGDFNQGGNPNSFDDFYGLPQDYEPGKNAMTAIDYAPAIRDRFKDDAKPNPPFRHHVAATVVARERIVYDYRSPVDCFENEIYPFMKYKLASAMGSESNAKANCLDKNKNGTINLKSGSTEFEEAIDQFFTDYPIESAESAAASTPTEDALKQKLKDLHANGNMNFDDFDAVSREVWQGYASNYETKTAGTRGEPSAAAKQSSYGVYKFLSGLRAKMGVPDNGNKKDFNPNVITDSPGDFLYYPEMTTNAMFISCGELNTVFYAGPDVVKYYNKIGCLNNDVGLRHSETNHFVHRVFGSEINLRIPAEPKIHRIDASYYIPPTRRKIYDSTLPHMGIKGNKYELVSHIVISWKDTAASEDEYKDF
ncbi:MAG: hypothetical protein CVV41_12335 [Candidatus Riflebacteria bacterium HGW-Riflebacteria-1]|jgi:hypothetical protein|nr:MAG: hypothetical protein CVV41_12335 [Candidatus Riflebacteria bacterium HGW-Riflebacteria-1]